MSRKLIWVVLSMVAVLVVCSIMFFNSARLDRDSKSEAQAGTQKTSATQDPTPMPTPNSVSKSCTLTTIQGPDINGVRLGLTIQQVLDLFPGSRDDAEVRAAAEKSSPLGVSTFILRPEKYGAEKKFVGITQFTLSFLDKRLSGFSAGHNGPQWKNVDEFVNKFSEGKTLPPLEAWEAYVGLDTQLKTLKCDGFEISVFAGGVGGNLNYVQMKDLAMEKELKERRAKAKKAAQKPTP